MVASQNYTLGRGEVFFGSFVPGTYNPAGERYIGNTPQFNINVEVTTLDHYSSDRGIREKDESIVNQVNRRGNLITDSIQPENVGLFFFGSNARVATTSATAQSETFQIPVKGLFYQLGVTNQRPQGVRQVANVIVAPSPTGTAYVAGTDYNVDLVRGRIEILAGGAITGPWKATYDITASTRDQIISGNVPIEGYMRYVAHNPEGPDYDYFMPYIKVSPNGDYALKSDEWQQMPLTIEILKLLGKEAIYIDGQPSTTP